MGWWSPGIMGGDTPLDIKGSFEDVFGTADVEWAAEQGLPPFRIPTADESESWLVDTLNGWSYEPDEPVIKQVTGFLLIQRGAPINKSTRQHILDGIDDEVDGGCDSWNDPMERIDALTRFRAVVVAYPEAGGSVELPHQPGLFETIANRMASGKGGLANDNIG